MRKRKVVTWNKNPETGHVTERALKQRPYFADAELPPETVQKLSKHLSPGALWKVASEWFGSQLQEPPGFEPPPHPYGFGSDWPHTAFPHKKGTVAIYLGTTRVEEEARGRNISVPRHTFMVEGNIYMVRRLTDMEPIE